MTANTALIQDRIEEMETGTGILDSITNGGLPKGRTILVSGTAGSSKTVSSAQSLAEGIWQFGKSGVTIALEESPADIRCSMLESNRDIICWRAGGRWTFGDGSPRPGDESIAIGSCDLGALLARVEHAVRQISAKCVVLDSRGVVFSHFAGSGIVRAEFLRITTARKRRSVPTITAAERQDKYGGIARYGIEECVAENIITPAQCTGVGRAAQTTENAVSCLRSRRARCSCSEMQSDGASILCRWRTWHSSRSCANARRWQAWSISSSGFRT